jgi:hypothetical protein
MRRRSEEEGARGVTDGEEARAVAMARQTVLQAVVMACEGKRRRGSLGLGEGECGEALGALI